LKLEIAESISQLDSSSWDELVGGMPLLSHAFLSALEESNSIGSGTGWQPCPMLVFDNKKLVGAMPLYVKHHSYGEYVFDWAWAEAYQKSGMDYYPKLISAIPFSPITSQRLLVSPEYPSKEIQSLMVEALEEIMHNNHFSSAHVLFPNDNSAEILTQSKERKLGKSARRSRIQAWYAIALRDMTSPTPNGISFTNVIATPTQSIDPLPT